MKMKLSAISLALLPVFASATTDLGSAKAAKSPDYSSNKVIVAYKGDATTAMRRSARSSVGARISDRNQDETDDRLSAIAGGRLAVYDLSRMSVKDAIKKLNADPAIAYAEPDYRLKIALTPDDPDYGQLWALNNTGQNGGTAGADISAEDAWDITTGSHDIVVGVIDTGVDYNHEDLSANIWTNPNEIAGNGIDDDNNGYVDDMHGINAITNSGDPMDDQGHGSHVSGTLGAVGNNGIGVVGVSHNVSIAGCKFLAADGFGSTTNAIKCVNYMVDLKTNGGVNLRVLNNSWGGGGESQALSEAIDAAEAADILFVVAAGNDGTDNDSIPSFPGNYPNDNVLTIANTTRTDSLRFDSQYGLTTVDMGAPGTSILSTIPGNGYATYSGTSMAAPQVAGAAALISSIKPDLTAVEVKQILMDSGDPITALDGITVSGNRLNAHAALLAADPDPGFNMPVDPRSATITAGETAEYTFTLSSVADWDGEVTLTISQDTLGGAMLSASSGAPGDTFTLSVPTAADTPWGDYSFEVTGTSGELVKTTGVSLYVNPQGLTDFPPYTNDTPMAIPDRDAAGITSVINVPDAITAFTVNTTVDITHTYIGDLIVSLTSPNGTVATLHSRAGGGTDNLMETFSSETFSGEVATGDWTLSVSDNAAADTGTLNSWSLAINGLGEITPQPPVAGFSFVANMLSVDFTDTSSDANNDIESWMWDFGDGNSSTEQSPSHTYAADGSYVVTLTVTDSEGNSDSHSMTVSVVSVVMTAEIKRAIKTRLGRLRVDIMYENASADMVDVYRNGVKIDTVENTGIYRDRERRATGNSFTYQICDAGSENCSNEVTASF